MSEQSSFWQRHHVRSFQELRNDLRLLFEELGVPKDVTNDLVLATQEACNNACQHGAEDTGCDVSVTCQDGTVTIEVADAGRGFDFETVRATWPPRLLRSSGRGLFIIAELTDHLEIVRRESTTLVRIVKAIE